MKKYRGQKYIVIDDRSEFELGDIITLIKLEKDFISLYVDDKGNEKYEYDIDYIGKGAICIKPLFAEHAPSSYHEDMKQLYDSNYELFVDKNRKYGNSFQDTFRNLGQISALTRMTDKFNRLTTMMLSEETDNEESVIDTLLDLSNYALMTVYELKQKEKENE